MTHMMPCVSVGTCVISWNPEFKPRWQRGTLAFPNPLTKAHTIFVLLWSRSRSLLAWIRNSHPYIQIQVNCRVSARVVRAQRPARPKTQAKFLWLACHVLINVKGVSPRMYKENRIQSRRWDPAPKLAWWHIKTKKAWLSGIIFCICTATL